VGLEVAASFGRPEAYGGDDVGGAEHLDAGAAIARVGVEHGGVESSDSSADDLAGAARGLLVEGAGLEGDEHDGVLEGALDRGQGHGFGVVFEGRLGVAARDDGAVANDDAADRRVRGTRGVGAASLLERLAHEVLELVARHAGLIPCGGERGHGAEAWPGKVRPWESGNLARSGSKPARGLSKGWDDGRAGACRTRVRLCCLGRVVVVVGSCASGSTRRPSSRRRVIARGVNG